MGYKKVKENGTKVYWLASYKDEEGIRRRKRCPTDNHAEVLCAKYKIANFENKNFDIIDMNMRIDKIIDTYVDEQIETTRDAKREKARAERLKKELGDATIRNIRKKFIKYRIKRLKEPSYRSPTGYIMPKTINNDHNFLSQAINWIGQTKNIPTPLKTLPRLPGEVTRDRTIEDEEFWKLDSNLTTQYSKDVIKTCYFSGMRINEVLTLTWDRVLWKEKKFFIPEYISKNHTSRKVPIDPRLFEILDRLYQGNNEGLVFLNTLGKKINHSCLHKTFKRACNIDKANISDFRIHDLRHCCLTRWYSHPKNDLKLIQEAAGHHDLKSTLRYIKFRKEKLNSIVENDYEAALLSDKKNGKKHPAGESSTTVEVPVTLLLELVEKAEGNNNSDVLEQVKKLLPPEASESKNLTGEKPRKVVWK